MAFSFTPKKADIGKEIWFTKDGREFKNRKLANAWEFYRADVERGMATQVTLRELARRAHARAEKIEQEIADFDKLMERPVAEIEKELGIVDASDPNAVANSKLDDAYCPNLPADHPLNLRSKHFATPENAAERLAQWEGLQKPRDAQSVLDELKQAGYRK